ncbi:MAG: proton-conducting transporter membrane subunit [Terriglobia bacterium]
MSAFSGLPHGLPVRELPVRLADSPVFFQLDPTALWLLLFGMIPAAFACWLGTPRQQNPQQRYWAFGAALVLLGALGVFGLQDAISFLIAWEIMSLGGAVMILGNQMSTGVGRSALFMLSLLEVGAVALLLAFLVLDRHTGSLAFDSFAGASKALSPPACFLIGLLFMIGFGAKLGLLPFYEWFPGAYGTGSGSTGAIFSGAVLNAAFFGLSRALVSWLPGLGSGTIALSMVVVILGVLSAILAILYAFQQEDWRKLLSFSTAENASVAVTALGASLLFRTSSLSELAALAWMVTMIHLAAHSLAKGALFLAADEVFESDGYYLIRQTGLLRRSSWVFGIGALFGAMSLAAMPPQAGFVSEWYIFQTLFQGFHVGTLFGRLTLALAAAGIALTAAVALATYVKLFGVGLLGDGHRQDKAVPGAISAAVFVLGALVLGLAVGMPWWLQALGNANQVLFGVDAARIMRNGWILVPLSAKFAFISPTLLVIVAPLLALVPLILLQRAGAFTFRRVPVWYGGRREAPQRIATTSLAFSNALRTFYSFVYGSTHDLTREYHHRPYFVKRLVFNQEVGPVFGPYLFSPITRFIRFLGAKVQVLQSGYLNVYTGIIGLLLVLILALALLK